jgi:hypothetical protein
MVADKAQIQRLLADPGGDEWRQRDIAQLLEDRLQDSNELYLDIMQQLQATMEELRKELAVDKMEFQKKVSSKPVWMVPLPSVKLRKYLIHCRISQCLPK